MHTNDDPARIARDREVASEMIERSSREKTKIRESGSGIAIGNRETIDANRISDTSGTKIASVAARTIETLREDEPHARPPRSHIQRASCTTAEFSARNASLGLGFDLAACCRRSLGKIGLPAGSP
jgi:hypothetical protein